MNCTAFEERIARYVGGDLVAEEAVALEQHLRQCAGCAEFARALEEDREWLASRPPEAADVDYLALRREIRREIARPRHGWKWVGIAAAILLAVGVATMPRKMPVKEIAAPVAQVPAVTVAPSKSAPKPKPRKPVPPPVVEVAEGDPTVEIHIATRDPNITIVLLHESKGVTQ